MIHEIHVNTSNFERIFEFYIIQGKKLEFKYLYV